MELKYLLQKMKIFYEGLFLKLCLEGKITEMRREEEREGDGETKREMYRNFYLLVHSSNSCNQG